MRNSQDVSGSTVAGSPLLTIVSVVKDDEAGLRETWQSVENQSFRDYEFLIVTPEDQSRLFSDLANSSAGIRIVVDPGEGIYQAMNIGLYHAQGEFIIFLNAGDVLVESPEALHMAMNEIVKRQVEWLAFSYRIKIGNKSKTHIMQGELTRGPFALGLKRVLHQALVARRSWMNRFGGFNSEYRIAGDYDFILRAISKRNLLTSRLVLSEFRIGGVSSRNPDLVRREIHESQRSNLPTSGSWRAAQGLWNGYWSVRRLLSTLGPRMGDQSRRVGNH